MQHHGLRIADPFGCAIATMERDSIVVPQAKGIFFNMTLRYTTNHEWLQFADDTIALVGITEHAQEALGDVVFVDLPLVGKIYSKGDVAGVVESVKAAADVYIPVDGYVAEVNEYLRADPSLANSDPLGQGWFFKLHISDPNQLEALMDEAAYAAFSAV